MRRQKRLRAIVDAVVELDKIWGRALVGVALLEACIVTGHVTVDSLAHRVRRSDDTIRRRLDALVKEGKLEMTLVNGRMRLYRVTPAYAERSIKLMERGGIL